MAPNPLDVIRDRGGLNIGFGVRVTPQGYLDFAGLVGDGPLGAVARQVGNVYLGGSSDNQRLAATLVATNDLAARRAAILRHFGADARLKAEAEVQRRRARSQADAQPQPQTAAPSSPVDPTSEFQGPLYTGGQTTVEEEREFRNTGVTPDSTRPAPGGGEFQGPLYTGGQTTVEQERRFRETGTSPTNPTHGDDRRVPNGPAANGPRLPAQDDTILKQVVIGLLVAVIIGAMT